jgi:hypothetical protein
MLGHFLGTHVPLPLATAKLIAMEPPFCQHKRAEFVCLAPLGTNVSSPPRPKRLAFGFGQTRDSCFIIIIATHGPNLVTFRNAYFIINVEDVPLGASY